MKRIFKRHEDGERHELLEHIMVVNHVVETNLLKHDKDKADTLLTASSIVNAMRLMESALFKFYPDSVIEEAYWVVDGESIDRVVDVELLEQVLDRLSKLMENEDR